jgi:WD40 repeat protein
VKDRAGAPLGAQVNFSINTGDELVTNLTVSPDGQWLACGSVQHCKLLDLRAGTGTLTERTVHSFQTDFAEPSPGQNVVRFQGSDALFTGGDDGQLRYWSIDSSAEGGGAVASVTLAAATQGEEGHRKPIGSIAIHGSAGLVATASKDGTCCVWQFAPAGKRGFRGSVQKAKGKSAKKAFLRKEQTLTLRAKGATDCRACVWSPVDGEHLFVLENCSARRKRQAAYITVYGHGKGSNVDTALEMGVFSLAPRNTQQVGNNPCTAMSICPNGRLLGLGDNGGMVSWQLGSGGGGGLGKKGGVGWVGGAGGGW